jgi:predicted ATP-grasp superfamily ATP-dependent carboligase
LVTAVAQAIPELWGYAGIDLLQTQRGLQVLEINPRLTTASAGLQAALGINLARAVIGLVRQEWTASDVIRQRDHVVKICWSVA